MFLYMDTMGQDVGGLIGHTVFSGHRHKKYCPVVFTPRKKINFENHSEHNSFFKIHLYYIMSGGVALLGNLIKTFISDINRFFFGRVFRLT
jgi:hypothetical protein